MHLTFPDNFLEDTSSALLNLEKSQRLVPSTDYGVLIGVIQKTHEFGAFFSLDLVLCDLKGVI